VRATLVWVARGPGRATLVWVAPLPQIPTSVSETGRGATLVRVDGLSGTPTAFTMLAKGCPAPCGSTLERAGRRLVRSTLVRPAPALDPQSGSS
jgi:hypothetical protein